MVYLTKAIADNGPRLLCGQTRVVKDSQLREAEWDGVPEATGPCNEQIHWLL